MRDRLKILLLLTFFWMGFFSLVRILFLLYNYKLTAHLTFTETLKSMLYGLKMDISMAGYILVLNGLILSVSFFYHSRALSIIAHTITVLFAVFSSLIVMVDLELYQHWGFRMNITPFFYMGSEATGTVPFLVALTLFIIIVSMLWVSLSTYFRYIAPQFKNLKRENAFYALPMLVITAIFILPIRGGLGPSTMNVGRVYFHPTKMFANHAGINVVWNFLYSLQNDNAIKYPEDFFDQENTEKIFKELYPKQDSIIPVLNSLKPNILLIILESFSADVVESLGGVAGVTPNLNAWSSQGILFTNFYASGDRTDKGLVSILSSYPSQPKGSIIKYPQKTQKLTYLSAKLHELGYQTSLVYGGDADFANYRSFFANGKFERITSEDDFSSDVKKTRWGVADEHVFEQSLRELDEVSHQPFFKVLLTVSSHEPFDIPMEPVFQGQGMDTLFFNACYYTDKWLGDFLNQAKEKDWWNNTLIIITADHGHRLPGNKGYGAKEKHRIPMLWLGGAVAKDTVINTFANQTDIANTVLAQINKPDSEMIFSKNILGYPVRDFTMYIFNDGYGYIDPERYIVFDNPGQQYLYKDGIKAEDEMDWGKAYIQKLYSDYNAKK